MVKSNTQPVVSKSELPIDTKTRWFVLSRIRSVTSRAVLHKTDDWEGKIEFFSENEAKVEFTWLNNHAAVREYCLVSVTKVDDLDDDIPF